MDVNAHLAVCFSVWVGWESDACGVSSEEKFPWSGVIRFYYLVYCCLFYHLYKFFPLWCLVTLALSVPFVQGIEQSVPEVVVAPCVPGVDFFMGQLQHVDHEFFDALDGDEFCYVEYFFIREGFVHSFVGYLLFFSLWRFSGGFCCLLWFGWSGWPDEYFWFSVAQEIVLIRKSCCAFLFLCCAEQCLEFLLRVFVCWCFVSPGHQHIECCVSLTGGVSFLTMFYVFLVQFQKLFCKLLELVLVLVLDQFCYF